MTVLTKAELEAIRKRAEAATPGPWSWWGDGTLYSEGEERILGKAVEGGDGIWFDLFDNDAEFIAHAREDIPKLLAEIERLKDLLENAKEMTIQYSDSLRSTQEELRKANAKVERYKKSLENIELLEPKDMSDESKFIAALYYAKIALEGDADDNEA